jgi:hypothetical protein
MRFISSDDSLLSLRGDGEGADVRLTERDLELLVRLASARWLSTRQVGTLCFPGVTERVFQRRLRLLRASRYVHSYQTNPMAEALHTLGEKGKELLLERGWKREIRLERMPPKQSEHVLGINDIRVAVERSARRDGIALGFFFASWELQQQGWSYGVIPDAACHVERAGQSLTALFEYDRGFEPPGYILRTKLRPYGEGLDGFPFSWVVVVVETDSRLEQLRAYTALHINPEKFSFLLRETLLDSLNLAQLFL